MTNSMFNLTCVDNGSVNECIYVCMYPTFYPKVGGLIFPKSWHPNDYMILKFTVQDLRPVTDH